MEKMEVRHTNKVEFMCSPNSKKWNWEQGVNIDVGHSRRSQHRFTGRLLRLYSKFIGWFVTKKERLSPSFSPQLGSPRPGGQKPFFSLIWIFNDFFCNFALKTLNLTEKKFWKYMIDGKFSVEHDAAISFLI